MLSRTAINSGPCLLRSALSTAPCVECGAWHITGKHGSIHTWGDNKTWVIWVGCRSGYHWTLTKARLGFCTVTQDGDDEGCLRLHELPTAGQAETIRAVLGLKKRREDTPETLQRLRDRTGGWNAMEPQVIGEPAD